MYDYIIVTHIPVFYKVNLYNELSKKLNILVVFIASDTNEKRSDDFITLSKINFEYQVLFDGCFQNRNVKNNTRQLNAIVKLNSYKKLLISGWDLKEFWFLMYKSPKNKNCLSLESTINESRVDGVRGVIKRFFLSRISKVFASGDLHVKLLQALKYNCEVKITKGVGIINKPQFDKIEKQYQKRFLYVGRLSSEKNIDVLIRVFNSLPDCTLTIIGVGLLERQLKNESCLNIHFLGAVDNAEIPKYLITNDFIILPSKSEPWGLVVEEALYFNTPAIVSNNCGASELIKDSCNGYVIDSDCQNLKAIISSLDNDKYQVLLKSSNIHCIDVKDELQVGAYI